MEVWGLAKDVGWLGLCVGRASNDGGACKPDCPDSSRPLSMAWTSAVALCPWSSTFLDLGSSCRWQRWSVRCLKAAAWGSSLSALCKTSCEVPVGLFSGWRPALLRKLIASASLSYHMAWASSLTGRVSGFCLGPAHYRLNLMIANCFMRCHRQV